MIHLTFSVIAIAVVVWLYVVIIIFFIEFKKYILMLLFNLMVSFLSVLFDVSSVTVAFMLMLKVIYCELYIVSDMIVSF